MTVNFGVLTELLMVVLGGAFMAVSAAKGLVISRTCPPVAATPAFRVLLFFIGFVVLIQGIRLLLS